LKIGGGGGRPGMQAFLKIGGGGGRPGIAAFLKIGGGGGRPGIAAFFLKIGGGGGRPGMQPNPFLAGNECVLGVADALTADRPITKPRATHETFNHDEDIWAYFRNNFGTCRKPNAKSAKRYNKSTEKTQNNCRITFTSTV
jgi:hypothetical protein